jgi:hypothetical protein
MLKRLSAGKKFWHRSGGSERMDEAWARRNLQKFTDFLHFEWGGRAFPREVGLSRQLVYSKEEFEKYVITQIKAGRPAYTSLYSQAQLADGDFRVGFIDIDFKEPLRGSKDIEAHAQILENLLKDKVCDALIVYSGGRGFHIYFRWDFIAVKGYADNSIAEFWGKYLGIYLPPRKDSRLTKRMSLWSGASYEKIKPFRDVFDDIDSPLSVNRTRYLYKAWVTRLVKYIFGNSGYMDSIDWNCVGDVRRMVKVPPSWGSVSHSYVVKTLMYDEIDESTLNDYIRLAEEAKREALEAVSAHVRSEMREEVEVVAGLERYPPCIADMVLRMVETGELSHAERFQLAAYLRSVGWKKEDVIDLFRAASDFDEHTTTYQVEHIYSNGYTPAGCLKIINMGACPRLCKLYPSGKYTLRGVRYDYAD